MKWYTDADSMAYNKTFIVSLEVYELNPMTHDFLLMECFCILVRLKVLSYKTLNRLGEQCKELYQTVVNFQLQYHV